MKTFKLIPFLLLLLTMAMPASAQKKTQKTYIPWNNGKLMVSEVNPEKRNVPLYKNDAFQKVQKRRVQKSGEPGPSLHDQSPPLFSHLNTI